MEGAGLEERLARSEGRVEELSKRVDDLRNDVNARFSELRNDMNHRFAELSKRIDDMSKRIDGLRDDIRRLDDRAESRFKWLMGTLITMWISIMAMLITIVL